MIIKVILRFEESPFLFIFLGSLSTGVGEEILYL